MPDRGDLYKAGFVFGSVFIIRGLIDILVLHQPHEGLAQITLGPLSIGLVGLNIRSDINGRQH